MEQTKAKTSEEIDNAAHRYAFSFDGEYQEGYNKRHESFIAGVNYANGVALELKNNLEAQNKELTDKYAVLVQDYSDKFYEQAKQIKELRVALEKIVKSDWTDEGCFGLSSTGLNNRAIRIAEQALKEDKQDG